MTEIYSNLNFNYEAMFCTNEKLMKHFFKQLYRHSSLQKQTDFYKLKILLRKNIWENGYH